MPPAPMASGDSEHAGRELRPIWPPGGPAPAPPARSAAARQAPSAARQYCGSSMGHPSGGPSAPQRRGGRLPARLTGHRRAECPRGEGRCLRYRSRRPRRLIILQLIHGDTRLGGLPALRNGVAGRPPAHLTGHLWQIALREGSRRMRRPGAPPILRVIARQSAPWERFQRLRRRSPLQRSRHRPVAERLRSRALRGISGDKR